MKAYVLLPWMLLGISSCTDATIIHPRAEASLVVDEAPNHVRPYVLPKYAGRAVHLSPSQPIRFSITTNATGGAFSLVQHSGKASGWTQARPHTHRRTHELFYCSRGRIQVWGQKNATGEDGSLPGQEARVGTVGDFASMPPGSIHTFQLTSPDSQMTHIFYPGGWEHLFEVFSGGDYVSEVGAPYPPSPEDAAPFGPITPGERERLATLDVYPTEDGQWIPRRDFVNGTATDDEALKWHDGNNTLPEDPTDPHFIARDHGPKFLNTANGYKIIQPLLTSEQNKNFTVGTIILAPKLANETSSTATLPHHFALQMEDGQLSLSVPGYPTELLLTGDVAFVPANVTFKYHATVPSTRFLYLNGGDRGLDHQLLKDSVPWGFPAYPIHPGFTG